MGSFSKKIGLLASAIALTRAATTPLVVDDIRNITFQGVLNHGVESFFNIQYGKDTSGARRFAPPEQFVIPSGSIYNATVAGPVCPQVVYGSFAFQSDATVQSEDCLRLKIARPSATTPRSRLPVMVYIYGGGLWNGQIYERTNTPDGLVLESIANGYPVLYVAMNYRLNIFGFALSEALRSNNSLNVGLKDQRLALEWVQSNIEAFGGDPNRVTIFGQSSGALSVTMQLLAYGGIQSPPFHGAIMQSTALEPTMTSNLTANTFEEVVALTECDSENTQSVSTIDCLRSLSMESLLNTTIMQQASTSFQNDGDTYLPTVDGIFLPAPASQLVREGRFSRMPLMLGWMQDDATLFTPSTINTTVDTIAFLNLYWPRLSNATVGTLLSLYPISSFTANVTADLSLEFYRSARIFRDILLTCPSFYVGHAMAEKYACPSDSSSCTGHSQAPVYLYNHNQTVLGAYLDSIGDLGLGVIHTSDLEYVFGNLSVYNISSAYGPAPSDYLLTRQMSRSWTTFANFGHPSLAGGTSSTLAGWEPAYVSGHDFGQARVFVTGGPSPGLSTLGGPGALDAIAAQRLSERCGFLNSEAVIRQLQY